MQDPSSYFPNPYYKYLHKYLSQQYDLASVKEQTKEVEQIDKKDISEWIRKQANIFIGDVEKEHEIEGYLGDKFREYGYGDTSFDSVKLAIMFSIEDEFEEIAMMAFN